MIRKLPIGRSLWFSLTALLIAGSLSAQEPLSTEKTGRNPFLPLIGKSYGEYHDAYRPPYDSIQSSSAQAHEYLQMLREAAAADPGGEWDYNYRMAALQRELWESRDGYMLDPGHDIYDYADRMLALGDQARQAGFRLVRLRAMSDAAFWYCEFARDYERAFGLYLEVAAALDTLTTTEFPPRPHIYRKIGEMYQTFREYDDAERFYRRIAEDPDAPANYYKSHYLALNNLGLCYRYGDGDYVRSDSCFYALQNLTADAGHEQWVWNGIAEANLGYNRYLQEEDDSALVLLESAAAKITRANDYPFLSGVHTRIASIYLRRNDLAAADRHIRQAVNYHRKGLRPEKSEELHRVLSEYSIRTGRKASAAAHLDSVVRMLRLEQKAFSGLVLRRVEQQLRAADNRLNEQRLTAERIRTESMRRTAFTVTAALAVITGLLVAVALLYRRKRRAYRELVRRSQQWAEIGSEKAEPTENGKFSAAPKPSAIVPDPTDVTIMEKIELLMKEKMLYTVADLSLDMLSAELGLDRRHVSSAINACARKNFFAYLNEYRVKEAIRIMSEAGNKNLTIDAIAFDSGFNDRKTFHRIFKQITGLTPAAFRDNL